MDSAHCSDLPSKLGTPNLHYLKFLKTAAIFDKFAELKRPAPTINSPSMSSRLQPQPYTTDNDLLFVVDLIARFTSAPNYHRYHHYICYCWAC